MMIEKIEVLFGQSEETKLELNGIRFEFTFGGCCKVNETNEVIKIQHGYDTDTTVGGYNIHIEVDKDETRVTIHKRNIRNKHQISLPIGTFY